MDLLGDHASCCEKTGDILVRHNRIRDLVDSIAAEGMLSPVMEKKGILGDTPGRRPGDVSIPVWSGGKGLAIDVAVTSPFAAYNVGRVDPCEHYSLHRKHEKYDEGFVGAS